MNVPANLKYADSHEWLRTESDGTVTVGITDHAQAALGDLVFVELPAVGRQLTAGEACAVFTPDRQKAMTPDRALAQLREGNERVLAGRTINFDRVAQAKDTASG